MIRLIYVEENNSTLKKTEENNKFKLHLFPESEIGGILNEKVRDEIENGLDISDITATDLQGSIMIEEDKEQVSKRKKKEEFCVF